MGEIAPILPAEPVEARGREGGEDLGEPLLGGLRRMVDHRRLGLDRPVGLALLPPRTTLPRALLRLMAQVLRHLAGTMAARLVGRRLAGPVPAGRVSRPGAALAPLLLRPLLCTELLLGLPLGPLLGLGAGARPLLGLAGADGGDALVDGDLEPLRRLRLVVEPGDR